MGTLGLVVVAAPTKEGPYTKRAKARRVPRFWLMRQANAPRRLLLSELSAHEALAV